MHVTVSSQSQDEKALLPILVSDSGNSIAVSLQYAYLLLVDYQYYTL